ncbi:MAG: OmpH family outer membrane protein [Cryomorphaceae bacterium]
MKYVIIAALSLLTIGSAVQAQTKQKFGHIDSQALLDAMPERKAADTKLEEFAAQLEKQLGAMSKELEAKVQDYKANEATMSDIIAQTKAEEIQNLQQRIQAFQQNAQQSLAKKEQEVYQPILDKAKGAIEKVSAANGFTYVFDTSSGALLFQPDGENILELVKKEMGITAAP